MLAMKLPSPNNRNEFLYERRNIKMARSPHAYMRGNTIKFYEWLESAQGQSIPLGPPIWICGDCHSGNLGSLVDSEGNISIEIRDFDQTVISNPAHDLVRLAFSLATAARGSRLPGVVTAHMLEKIMQGYEYAFAVGAEEQHLKYPHAIRGMMRKAGKRSWKQLAKERIVDTRPIIPLNKNFWRLSQEEKSGIAELFADQDVLSLVRTLKSRSNDAHVEVLDAAFWVKGCSSLGLLRYAVLLNVGDKKSSEHCLVDIKQAVKAVAPRYSHIKMPRDNAHRVISGARRLSPALGDRMVAQRFLDQGVFIRELLPQDLKLEIDELTLEDATDVAHYLAYVIGRAHARQMDEATRERWRIELNLDRNKILAAPDWLWDSVVQLMSDHEVGYLEHCRKYALGRR